MKTTILFTVILLISLNANAQYRPEDRPAAVRFKIENFGFEVTGSFTGLAGNISFDPLNPSNDSFDVSIRPETINTENSLRDEHLRGDVYFDVQHFSQIRLISDKITVSKGGHYVWSGRLCMKGISKDISFTFTALPLDHGYHFKGSFKILRKDFGIGGASTISNELEIELDVQANKF